MRTGCLRLRPSRPKPVAVLERGCTCWRQFIRFRQREGLRNVPASHLRRRRRGAWSRKGSAILSGCPFSKCVSACFAVASEIPRLGEQRADTTCWYASFVLSHREALVLMTVGTSTVRPWLWSGDMFAQAFGVVLSLQPNGR